MVKSFWWFFVVVYIEREVMGFMLIQIWLVPFCIRWIWTRRDQRQEDHLGGSFRMHQSRQKAWNKATALGDGRGNKMKRDSKISRAYWTIYCGTRERNLSIVIWMGPVQKLEFKIRISQLPNSFGYIINAISANRFKLFRCFKNILVQ